MKPPNLFESKRGTRHAARRLSEGNTEGRTLCGLKLRDGWEYRGIGTPTCKHCKTTFGGYLRQAK